MKTKREDSREREERMSFNNAFTDIKVPMGTMNETIKTILERKSCKSYDPDKKVSKSDIETIVKCGLQAPSAMNTQAWHLTVITNENLLKEMNEAVFETVDEATRRRIISRSLENKFNFNYRCPVFIIVSCSDSSPFPGFDCACVLENMFLAATSLNLGSCWINQLTTPLSEKPAIRKFLDKIGVPKENKVYGCCALGYAKIEPAAKERAKNTVTWIE